MNQTVDTAVAFNSIGGTSVSPVRSDSHRQDACATKGPRAALKVCIIGLKCYDHITEKPVPQYLGGIETQMAVLAKGLHGAGCDVSLITFDHGQANREVHGGVAVFKSYPASGGVRFVRSFQRASKLFKAIREADADIYLQMGAGSETGFTSMGRRFESSRARKFVFCLACDADTNGPLGSGRYGLETMLYKHGIKGADLIISQTQKQQANLESSLGLKSRIIPMAVTKISDASPRRPKSVLWVGRLMQEKRFEWLLEAARQCPDIEFNVAGTPNQPSGYAAELMSAAAKISNVRVHGKLSRPDLNRLFETCGLLCCTSMLEGFPTTFLEAWSCGLPVVTTFDPDGIVAREGLGRVVTTIDELVAQLRALPNSDAYFGMSNTAKKFFAENYSVETISRRFRQAFEEVVAS